ncbi:hypothetical protein C2E23DRAFT_539287 [Lenzites betulinus]|nr:hypothetical protein C2E23DRAFT_539287 [Lenzites betulinus]
MHGQGLGEIPATLERIWGGQSTFNVTQALIRTSRNADLIIHLHNDKNSLNAVFGPQGHVTNTDLGATFNAEPLSANIRKLWIQEIWGDVCPILASLPSLEFLFIEPPLPGSPPSELALTEVSKHLSVQEKRPIALPSLSTLAIFARHYEVPSKCGLPANHQLNDVQRARADAGHPIRRLFIATDRSTGSAVCHEHDERGVLMRRMIPTGRAKEELVSEWRRGTNWTSHEGLVQTDTTWSLDN